MLISEIIKVPLYPAGVTPDIVTLDPLAKPVRFERKYVATPTDGKLGVILMSVAVKTTGVISPFNDTTAFEYPATPGIDKEIVPLKVDVGNL